MNVKTIFSKNKLLIITLMTIINIMVTMLLFNRRELMSELLVVNTIDFNTKIKNLHYFGLVFYDNQPYFSQVGLHGYLFSLPLVLLKSHITKAYLIFILSIVSFLFFLVQINIYNLIKEKISKHGSKAYLLIFILNIQFFINISNLYWLYFLLFLPLWYCLDSFSIKQNNKQFYSILGLLFALKYVCNFEFLSTMILSCLIPIFYELMINRSEVYKYIKHLILLFISAFIPFILIFSMFQIVQPQNKSDNNIFQRIQEHSGSKEKIKDKRLMNSNINLNLNYYKATVDYLNDLKKSDYFDIPYKQNYDNYKDILKYIKFDSKVDIFYSMQLIIALISTIFINGFYIRVRTDQYRRFAVMVNLSFLASISWIILMPVHFYWHSVIWRGITDIVLFFPFYSFTVVMLIELLLNWRKKT